MRMMQLKPGIQYFAIREAYISPCTGRYRAYAVMVRNNQKAIAYVPDVFLKRKQAKRFVLLCNRLALDPVHLFEAIEDALD